jgi:tetratricopeptide (TPR) repeat protein
LRLDEQAAAEFQAMADNAGVAYALSEKADQLAMLGDLSQAQQTSERVVDLVRKSGGKHMLIASLIYLGQIYGLQGNLEGSQKAFTEALSVGLEAGESGLVSEAKQGLAEINLEHGQLVEARKEVNDSLDYLHQHKIPNDEIAAHALLARISLMEGKPAEAAQEVEQGRTVLRQGSEWEGKAVLGVTDGRVQAASGKFTEAQRSLKDLIAETTRRRNVRYELEARLALCEVEAKANPNSGRAEARVLEKDANTMGFGLIARKAHAIAA